MTTYRITKTETIVYQRELNEEEMADLLSQAGVEFSDLPPGTTPDSDTISHALDDVERPWPYRYDWEWLERHGDVDGSTLVIERIEGRKL